jgi:phosphoglycolate phosphatase
MDPKLNLPPLRAAIVDLDGTMIDTLGDFVVALNRMLQELRLPGIERPDIERMIGKGSEHLVLSVLAHVGRSPYRFPAAWDAYLRIYLAINVQKGFVFPGVLVGLALLK